MCFLFFYNCHPSQQYPKVKSVIAHEETRNSEKGDRVVKVIFFEFMVCARHSAI